MRSAMGSGAGRFLGRPRLLLGAIPSTGGANRGASGVLCDGCETEAGSWRRSRRLAIGDEEAGRVGVPSTTRSILMSVSSESGDAGADSIGVVFSSTEGSAATRTGKARGLATTAASLEAPGGILPHDASSAYKGKVDIGLMCARVR